MGFISGLHKQMIVASYVSGTAANRTVMPTIMYILLTLPRYTSCNKDSHTCANYRNNVCPPLPVCVCVCVIARVCEWGKTSGNNNTGDDDNDLQLHVFFTISRTSLDFGLPDTLTALNENDGQEEFARLTDTLCLTISTR